MKNTLKKNALVLLLFTSLCSGAQPSPDLSEDESPEAYLLRWLANRDNYYEDEDDPVVRGLQLQQPNPAKEAALQSIALKQQIDPEYFIGERHPLDFFFLSQGKKEDLYKVEPTTQIEVALPFWYQALHTKAWIPLLQLLTHSPEIFQKNCNQTRFWELFAQSQPPLEIVEQIKDMERVHFPMHITPWNLASVHPRTQTAVKQSFIARRHDVALDRELFGSYRNEVATLCAAELAAGTYDPSLERPHFNAREHLDDILLSLFDQEAYAGFNGYFALAASYHIKSEELLHLMGIGFSHIVERNKSCTPIPFRFITAALTFFPPEDIRARLRFLEECQEAAETHQGKNSLWDWQGRAPQLLSVIDSIKNHCADHKKM